MIDAGMIIIGFMLVAFALDAAPDVVMLARQTLRRFRRERRS